MIHSIEQLRERIAPVASKHQLVSVCVFGSYALGEATEESVVDLLVDMTGTSLDDMLAMGGLYNDLSEALGKNIDLLTTSVLAQASTRERTPWLEERLEKEKVKIFG